ncbi:endo-1,4-D-glucanase [Gammaproteobacteria bacterium]|nr:endo-1,4-D-glucanase [Gammaproteobacteria bacterium]
MKIKLFFILMLLTNSVLFAQVKTECNKYYWSEWEYFKKHYISDDGRVIDPAYGLDITTSEGQSYALFFALVANDQAMFASLIKWTENNLAAGDLSNNIPAWLWGKNEKGEWGIKDFNSASNSDIWIAYSLLEAARLWNKPDYNALGTSLLKHIYAEEVAELPNLGRILLPGKERFVYKNFWRLNPGNTPPQLLNKFNRIDPIWNDVIKGNRRLLLESGVNGLASDWVVWDKKLGWQFYSEVIDWASKREITKDNNILDVDAVKKNNPNITVKKSFVRQHQGNYNAIRVYLLIGMMAEDSKYRNELTKHYSPMIDIIRPGGLVPEIVNALEQRSEGTAPIGFSAALLPFSKDYMDMHAKLLDKVNEHILDPDEYHNIVLILFGKGFDDKRYRFNKYGELLPEYLEHNNPCKL